MKNHWMTQRALKNLSEDLLNMFRGASYKNVDEVMAAYDLFKHGFTNRIWALRVTHIHTQFELVAEADGQIWVRGLKISQRR